MILLTTDYDSGSLARNIELRECFDKNRVRGLFDDRVIFAEPSFLRTTFRRFFEIANIFEPGTLCCLANADIAFDATINLLAAKHFDGRFMCLSRWNKAARGLAVLDDGAAYTQDAWAFKTPVKIPETCDFPLGQRGCDNKIAWLMDSIGYKLFNPSLTVKALHVHDSGFRTYRPDSAQVPGPYKQVPPTELV